MARGARTDAGDSPFFLGTDDKVEVPGQEDDVAKFIATSGEHRALDPRLRTTVLLLVAAVVLVPVSLLLPQDVIGLWGGADSARVASSLSGRAGALGQMFSGTAVGDAMQIYFWQALAVALAGAGLALSGAVYQGTLKNALASPSTLGIMSGGTLGMVVYALVAIAPADSSQPAFIRASELAAYYESMDPLEYIMTTQARAFCSLLGCVIVAALVLLIAYIAGRGRVSKVGLIIAGQVFSAIIAGVVEMVRYYLRDYGTSAQVDAIRYIMGGSFDNITGPLDVALVAVPVLLGIVIIMALRTRLNLLAFDDEEARSLGLSTARTRNAVVIVCTLVTAVIVSFCGAVGFVGFLVPHLARRLVGPNFRYYIPASVCLGAAYLLVAQSLMNMFDLFSGSIGTFTSLIGIVCFVVLAVRERARGNADWI